MSYITRSGRHTKKVNYSDTIRRGKKKHQKKRPKLNVGKNPATQQKIDPNQLALIIKALYPPANINECDYMSSVWKSIHTLSDNIINENDNYKKSMSHRGKSSNNNKNSKKQKISKKRGKLVIKRGRIYKLRRPRTAWLLYNSYKLKNSLKKHPTLNVCQRTKMTAKLWHGLGDGEKNKWIKKAKNEKNIYLKVKKGFEKHKNWNKVPERWKQIDKKAEKERDEILMTENDNELDNNDNISMNDSNNSDSESNNESEIETERDPKIQRRIGKRKRKVSTKIIRSGQCSFCMKQFNSIPLALSHMQKKHNFVHY